MMNFLSLDDESTGMKNESSLSSTIWSGVLLFTVFFTVFIVALFPVPWHKYLYKAGLR